MERIHVDEPVLVKTSHFTERLEGKKRVWTGEDARLCAMWLRRISLFHWKNQWWLKKWEMNKKKKSQWEWGLIPEVLEGGRKMKQHHLDQKKKKKNKIKRIQKLTSHSPFLFPRFLGWYRKQWVDVATPWSLHVYDGRRWQRPYTDMMCLTKAAAGRRERADGTNQWGRGGSIWSRKLWECWLTLIVDTAVLILLSGHESVDLSLIHLLSCRGSQRTRFY